jgi:hypothetical protein
MAGAILYPFSAVPVTAPRVFPNIYTGGGANSKHESGLGWEASVGADSTWRLRFRVPTALPSGTAKFSGWCLANATSGDAKLNVKWVSVANGESPSAATPVAETVATLTWAAGENDKYKELLVTMDADTVMANEVIVMDIVGETSGWTLTQILTMVSPCIVFA